MDVGNHIAGTRLRIRCQFGRHHQVRDFLLAHLRDERWWRHLWQRREIRQVLRSRGQPGRRTLALQLARALCEDRLALVHDPHSPWSALEVHPPHIWQLMQAAPLLPSSAAQKSHDAGAASINPELQHKLIRKASKHSGSNSSPEEDEFFAESGRSDEIRSDISSAPDGRAKGPITNKNQHKPGDHDFVGPVKANAETVFSGHGAFFPEHGTTVVPEGTTITFYSIHGATISDKLGNAIELGNDLSRVYKKTYTAGDEIPNYVLQPGTNLNIKGRPITVKKDTPLSELLKPGMGNCHWAACTYNPYEEFSHLMFHTDGIIDINKQVYFKKYDKPKPKKRSNGYGSQ